MFKKILVPIAFSKYSPGILRFAARLAKPLGAELLIANVVNQRDIEAVEKIARFGYKVDGDHYIATVQKERVEKLEKMMGDIALDEDQYAFTFLAGDPTSELLRIVVQEGVDLIVMGTKTRDIKHIFTGSVAEKMFRRCPVSIVSYRDDDIADELRKKVATRSKS